MAEYFSHDYHARNDLKIVTMRTDLGLISLGAYWCLIEILYEQNGRIKITDLFTISKVIGCDISLLEKIVFDYGLFVKNGEHIENNSINKRLKVRKEKSEKASVSAKSRWSKYTKELENSEKECDRNATSNAPIVTVQTSDYAKKKRKEKNKKNTNIASELFSIEDRLLFDDIWVANAAKSLSVDKSRLESLVKKFNTHLLTIKKEHTNVSEYASHFLNWCRISKNDNNQNKSGQITSSTPVN